MRETSFSIAHLNRATKSMSNSQYDRYSINCTDVIPLLSSLNHLIFLTSTSSPTRETIVKDGGLEQLIHILKTTKVTDIRTGWKWSMAYQCVVNIGVRGNENIRKRVVESGVIPIVINILETFLNALEHIKAEKDRNNPNLTETVSSVERPRRSLRLTNSIVAEQDSLSSQEPTFTTNTTIEISPSGLPIVRTSPQLRSGSQIASSSGGPLEQDASITLSSRLASVRRSINSPSFSGQNNDLTSVSLVNETNSEPLDQDEDDDEEGEGLASSPPSWLDQVLYREEDILLSLQLLAYLSKYPCLRHVLHSCYEPINVFRLVEQFTSRHNAHEVQYWSGIIMRNACRKDEARGGLRRCAFMSCGKWETYPREFAKCRRCRKAKYCSKVCQSRAWTEGHRYWCVERASEAPVADEPTGNSNTNTPGLNSTNAQLPTPEETPILNIDPLSQAP